MMEASCWQEGEPMSIGDPLTATDVGGWGKKDAGTSNVNGTSKCRFTYPRLNHSNIHYRGIVVRFHLKKLNLVKFWKSIWQSRKPKGSNRHERNSYFLLTPTTIKTFHFFSISVLAHRDDLR